MRKLSLFFILLLVAGCADKSSSDIEVLNAWIAEIPPVISVTAALMTLRNNSDKPRYLTTASSPKAERIEIHRSFVVNDLARMQQQPEVEVPAHGSVVFDNESGYHLMFYGTEQIKAGQQIPVTLKFRDGFELTIVYQVRDRRDAD